MSHNIGYRKSQHIFTRNAVKQKTMNRVDQYQFRGGIRL